jgi:ATP-binding cassette subfamily F protein 3
VLDTLERTAPPEWRPRLRSLLGSFLFSGDDVFKLCRVLSGGERQRVALARILLEPVNLLLLDEPTHHLDIAGKEVLEDALDQYPGAVVVVTHDRSLMGRLATRILEVEGGRVIPYPGGYDDYESARLARNQVVADSEAPAPARRGSAPRPLPDARKNSSKAAASSRTQAAPIAAARDTAKRSRAEQQKRERDTRRIEKDIEQREGKIKELETMLADPEIYHDGARAKQLIGDYEKLKAELDSLWQRLGEA